MEVAMVLTKLGELPQCDLRHKLVEADSPQVLCVACEWYYHGSDPRFAEHVGTMVRRDVWANVKVGLRSQSTLGA